MVSLATSRQTNAEWLGLSGGPRTFCIFVEAVSASKAATRRSSYFLSESLAASSLIGLPHIVPLCGLNVKCTGQSALLPYLRSAIWKQGSLRFHRPVSTPVSPAMAPLQAKAVCPLLFRTREWLRSNGGCQRQCGEDDAELHHESKVSMFQSKPRYTLTKHCHAACTYAPLCSGRSPAISDPCYNPPRVCGSGLRRERAVR